MNQGYIIFKSEQKLALISRKGALYEPDHVKSSTFQLWMLEFFWEYTSLSFKAGGGGGWWWQMWHFLKPTKELNQKKNTEI